MGYPLSILGYSVSLSMLGRDLAFDKSLSDPWEAHWSCYPGAGGPDVLSRTMMFHHCRCLVGFFTKSLGAATHIGFIRGKRFHDCPGRLWCLRKDWTWYLMPWSSCCGGVRS